MVPIRIERARDAHVVGWLTQRSALWPDASLDEHRHDIRRTLSSDTMTAFVALADDGAVVGFAEASKRLHAVNGCDTVPVAFLEGIHVDAAVRQRGVARALCAAVEEWGQSTGCRELASDTDWENAEGQAFHAAIGFEETERVVFFRKLL